MLNMERYVINFIFFVSKSVIELGVLFNTIIIIFNNYIYINTQMLINLNINV